MSATRQGPLSRFKVIDLTRARAGPTAARQFADWGADVIKVEVPAGRRRGPDDGRLAARSRLLQPAPQQAQHHAQPQDGRGRRRPQEDGGRGRRADRELPARREAPARLRLRDAARDQPAPRLRQPVGLRPGRAVRQPARLRPDRPGHGRPDVDHRPARPGAGAGRRADRGPLERHVCRHGRASSRCSSARCRARASG